MNRPLTLLLCITGAAAIACSKDKPAESAYDTTVTERPVDAEPLTPASSDGVDHSKMDHSGTNHSGMDHSGMDHSGTGTGAGSSRTDAPDTIPQRDATNGNDGGDSTRTTSPSNDSSRTAADNTARNERDRNSSAVTPMDQGNSQSDLDVTQKIRQAVMKDNSLSFTAKNVKIITRDGKVTLRGTVPTYEERLAIETAARNVVCAPNVVSELEVKK
jgi:hyperosmotically inducible periplasmic protein